MHAPDSLRQSNCFQGLGGVLGVEVRGQEFCSTPMLGFTKQSFRADAEETPLSGEAGTYPQVSPVDLSPAHSLQVCSPASAHTPWPGPNWARGGSVCKHLGTRAKATGHLPCLGSTQVQSSATPGVVPEHGWPWHKNNPNNQGCTRRGSPQTQQTQL